MSEYVKKNISIPADLNERLSKEGNASAVICEALKLHYGKRDAVERIILLAVDLNNKLPKLLDVVHGKIEQKQSTVDPPKFAPTRPDPELGYRCCQGKSPCKHWVWNTEKSVYVNTLTGKEKEPL